MIKDETQIKKVAYVEINFIRSFTQKSGENSGTNSKDVNNDLFPME